MVETETSIHRALADERRVAIIDALRADGPLDVRELGRRVWLHPNTVRFHLSVLRAVGLVTARSDSGGRRGRPRVVYAVDDASVDGARLLATVLAAALEQLGGEFELDDLQLFLRPGVCVARLRRAR
jgi:predicted ArsR family transcriptional regulator